MSIAIKLVLRSPQIFKKASAKRLPLPVQSQIGRFVIRAAAALIVTAAPAAAQSSETSNTKIVENYFDAWNRGDMVALADVLQAEVKYFNTTNAEMKTGEQEIISVAEFLKGMIPNRRMTMVSRPIVNGNRIAIEWQFDGTLPRDGGGADVSFRGSSIFEVDAGEISYVGDYYNSKAMESQLEP